MKIRAHHLLCMRYFKGHGYSDEFVLNMSHVIKRLKNNPKIQIVTCVDEICSKCPHNDNGCVKKGPESELKVKEHDKRVLEAAGIDENQVYFANDVIYLVNKKIKDVSCVCKDCSWIEYCK